MRKITRSLALASLLLLGSYTSASAATLRTPFLLADTYVRCVATNLGDKPIDMAITLIDAAGAPLPGMAGTCIGALPPKGTCSILFTAFSNVSPRGGFCSFTSSKKFRAVGYGASVSGSVVVAFPATK